jgi:hypothetical protein
MATATTEIEDFDGEPPGRCWQQGSTVVTPEVEDVNGGPPRGCWRQGPATVTTEVEVVDGRSLGDAGGKVRQRPPPKLKTSMAGP